MDKAQRDFNRAANKAFKKPKQKGLNALPAPLRGADNASKILGGLVSMGKGVYDLVKMIKQHPQWYTHYDTSNLVAMNLAFKQNVAFPATGEYRRTGSSKIGVGMPAIAAMNILLTLPQDDLAGWQTGIRLIYQQLRTANSGKINYRVQDVEKYIFNVRQLRAINAWLKRLYNLTYTFRSTNSAIPRQMIAALRLDFENIMKNAADLFMYTQRFAEQCQVSFPGYFDLCARAEWMFGNIFVDSNSHKPAFYIPTFEPVKSVNSTDINGVQYFVYDDATSSWKVKTGGMTALVTLGTYDRVVGMCEQIKNELLNDSMMTIIAGDMIKAFGDRAFVTWPKPLIDEGACAIYDQDALSQWQNAAVINMGQAISYPVEDNDRGHALVSTARYQLAVKADGWAGGSLGLDWPDNVGVITDAEMLITRANNYLVNWHDNKIDSGHVMSITRLIPTGATRNSNAGQILSYATFGTEVVSGVFVLYQQVSNFTSPVQGVEEQINVVPISGYIYYDTNASAATIELALGNIGFWWAAFDWAPRYSCVGRSTSGTGLPIPYVEAVGFEVLDWDVFALIQASELKTYYSYGNQSLLYLGASQNQSNTKVYGRREKNKMAKSESPKPEEQRDPKMPEKTPEDKR